MMSVIVRSQGDLGIMGRPYDSRYREAGHKEAWNKVTTTDRLIEFLISAVLHNGRSPLKQNSWHIFLELRHSLAEARQH
jgi:ATP-dependent DNA ligase